MLIGGEELLLKFKGFLVEVVLLVELFEVVIVDVKVLQDCKIVVDGVGVEVLIGNIFSNFVQVVCFFVVVLYKGYFVELENGMCLFVVVVLCVSGVEFGSEQYFCLLFVFGIYSINIFVN